MSAYRFSAVVAFLAACVPTAIGCVALSAIAQAPAARPPQGKPAPSLRTAALPIAIEPSATAANGFIARTGAAQMHIAANGFDVASPAGRIGFTLVGSSGEAQPTTERTPGESNYLIGPDSAQWRTHVPHFGRVGFSGVYPGIGTAFYGAGARMEHDFLVSPGASASSIRMRVDAGNTLTITPAGDLRATGKSGTVLLYAPVAYQDRNGKRITVHASFHQLSRTDVGFTVQNADPALPITIDPVVDYSTYLGASYSPVSGLAVDSANNTYVAGMATVDYPATTGSRASTCAACTTGSQYYAYVTKLNPTGTAQIYSTFVGGNGGDQVYALAVDPSGNAVVTGQASDSSFPTKNPLPNTAFTYARNAFAFSLAQDGAALNFSTPFSSSTAASYLNAVTTGADGSIYITGTTSDATFPYTTGAIANASAGSNEQIAILLKLTSAGALTFGARIGDPGTASGGTGPRAIHLNSDGTILIAGTVGANNFSNNANNIWPITSGAYQSALLSSASNAPFVTKVSADATTVLFSTYVGSGSATGMDTTPSGDILITGYPGTGFPTTTGAYGTATSSAYLARLKSDGTALLASTTFSSAQSSTTGTTVNALRTDSSGNVWVAGSSYYGFPQVKPIQPVTANTYSTSALLAEFDANLQNLLFSTYLNNSADTGSLTAMQFDAAGKLHLAGITYGTHLPTTPGVFRLTVPSTTEAVSTTHGFVALIDPATPGPALCVATGSNITAQVGFPQTGTVVLTSCGAAPLTVSAVTYAGSPAIALTSAQGCTGTLAAGATCSVGYTFTPTVSGTVQGAITVQANTWQPAYTVAVLANGTAPAATFVANPVTFQPAYVGGASTASFAGVQNAGTANLLVYGAQASVTGDFAIATNSCKYIDGTAYLLYPQAACSLRLTFTPTAAGTRTGTLTVPNNDPNNPSVVINLTGNAVDTYPAPTLTSLGTYAVAAGTAGFTLDVRGTGFFPESKVLLNGVAQTPTLVGNTSLSVAVPVALLSGNGNITVAVQNPAPGGGISNSETLTVYQSLTIASNALVYEPVTARLYATIGSTATSNPNTVAVIDPTTGTVQQSIAVGTNPGRLAASGDGHYLFVAAEGDHHLQRIDLTTGLVDRTFTLPKDALLGIQTTVNDMHVVPGAPQSVVVSLAIPASPSGGGGALFNDNGLVSYLSNTYPKYYNLPSFAFTSDPGTVYSAFFNGSTLNSVLVSASALTGTASTTGFGASNSIALLSDGALLYGSDRSIYDPVQLKRVATFSPSTTFGYSDFNISATDSRAYFVVTPTTSLATDTYSTGLLAFDLVTRQQTGAIGLNLAGVGTASGIGTTDLQRFGTDGFAGRSSTAITLFHSAITTSTPANTPFIAGLAPSYLPFGSAATAITVTGSGFSLSSSILFNGSARTTTFNSSTSLTVQLTAADLATAGKFSIAVQNGATTSGAYPFQVVGNPITASVSTLTFAAQLPSSTSAAQTVTFTNSSGAALTGLTYAVSGANASDFALTSSCPASLANGASCTGSLTFTPAAVGTRTATLAVLQNGTALNQSVALTGTGATPSFSLSNSSFTYGTIGANSSVFRLVATLTNTGQVPLTNLAALTSGTNSSEFLSTGVTCPSGSGPGTTCTMTVAFAPASVGDKSAVLTVTADNVGAQTVALTGHGGLVSFTLTPSTLDFGSAAPVGTQLTRTAVITNTGEVTLGGVTGTYTYASATDITGFQFSNCLTSIGPGDTCTVTVTWTPPRAGQLSSAVGIDYGLINTAGNPLKQHLSLAGTAGTSVVTFSPSFVDFGAVAAGTTVTQAITVTNPGSTTLSPLTITSAASGGTAITSTNNCGAGLSAYQSCTINVSCTAPANDQGQSLTLTAGNTTAGTRTLRVTESGVIGYGTKPYALSFGPVVLGKSSTQSLTVTNLAQGMSFVPTVAGTNAADFVVGSECTGKVGIGQSCTYSVTFTPSAAGDRSAVLTAGIYLYGGQQLSLTGMGTATPPSFQLTANGSFNNFGSVALNGFKPLIVGSVTNTGSVALTNLAATVTGANSSEFQVSGFLCSSGTGPGANCSLNMNFRPVTAGDKVATVTVTADGAAPQTLQVTGHGGLSTQLTLSAASLDFKTLTTGSTAQQTVTVTNNTAAAITGITAAVSLGDFAQANTCGSGLAVGASCVVSVTFQPTVTVAQTATLTLNSTGGTAQTVALTGQGVAPTLSSSVASVNFGTGTIGQTVTQSVTLTNSSTVPITSITLFVAGANPADFSTASNCPATLAAAATCTLTARFTPSAAGARAAQLQVLSTNATTLSVALQGTGVADFAIGGTGSGTPSTTVTAGQPASYSLAFVSSGTTGSVAFSCNNLPTYASCSFNPATASAAASSTVALTITTQATVTAGLRPASPGAAPDKTHGSSELTLAALGGLGLLAAVRRRSRIVSHLALLCACALISVCGLLGLTGCASGSGSSPTNPLQPVKTVNTPAGTYTVQVVATVGTATHSTPVTLVVQ